MPKKTIPDSKLFPGNSATARKAILQKIYEEQVARMELQESRALQERLKDEAHTTLAFRLIQYRYHRLPHRSWREVADDLLCTSEEMVYAVSYRRRDYSRPAFIKVHQRLLELEREDGLEQTYQCIWGGNFDG